MVRAEKREENSLGAPRDVGVFTSLPSDYQLTVSTGQLARNTNFVLCLPEV